MEPLEHLSLAELNSRKVRHQTRWHGGFRRDPIHCALWAEALCLAPPILLWPQDCWFQSVPRTSLFRASALMLTPRQPRFCSAAPRVRGFLAGPLLAHLPTAPDAALQTALKRQLRSLDSAFEGALGRAPGKVRAAVPHLSPLDASCC